MARVGTLRWADQTGGQLRVRDHLTLLIGQAVPTWVGSRAEAALLAMGLGRPIDLDGIDVVGRVESEMPDTPMASVAAEVCRTVSEPWLVAHSFRTFAFGVLLARERPFDREVLYLSALLHDVGLTRSYERGADPGLVRGYRRSGAPCFAVRGAGVAQALGDEHASQAAVRSTTPDMDAVAEAISLHVNVRVRRSQGIEAHLLNVASALDVVGLRSGRLGRDAVRAVEDRWPRAGSFADDIWTTWACEAAAHPRCRARLLSVWGRFRHKIYRSHPHSTWEP